MSIFNKSTVAATAKAKATPAGSIPTADCQKACRQLETWGVEQNETEIRRYLADQAALKGGSRLSKKEFLKTHLEDEYSESLSRKLWVVPRRQKKVDAFVADLEDGAVVSPGLLFKPPSGIDLGAYWFVDASVPIEKLGFGVMEHYTTVKAKATTSETGGSGGPPALTAGAGSSGDTVPHPLFDALAHDAPAPPPAAKKPRAGAKTPPRPKPEETVDPKDKGEGKPGCGCRSSGGPGALLLAGLGLLLLLPWRARWRAR